MTVARIRPGELHDADAEWLWLCEGVEPEAGAEQTLLDAAREFPDAVLLQPKLLDATGRLVLPPHWPRYGAVREVIDGAEHRVLPLRAAGFHGAMLRRDAVPRGVTNAWELTATMLRDSPGYLAPAAVARLTQPLRAPSPREMVRVAASREAWTPRERFDLRVQALASRGSDLASRHSTARRMSGC